MNDWDDRGGGLACDRYVRYDLSDYVVVGCLDLPTRDVLFSRKKGEVRSPFAMCALCGLSLTSFSLVARYLMHIPVILIILATTWPLHQSVGINS